MSASRPNIVSAKKSRAIRADCCLHQQHQWQLTRFRRSSFGLFISMSTLRHSNSVCRRGRSSPCAAHFDPIRVIVSVADLSVVGAALRRCISYTGLIQ